MKLAIFIALALPTVVVGQEQIKVFKTQIISQQVNGDNHFGPKKGNLRQKLISDRLSTNSATQSLGQVILEGKLREPFQLLDINRENSIPLLDSINLDYYINIAIPNTLDEMYLTSGDSLKYSTFRDEIKKPDISNAKRKAILYKPQYIKFRRTLERSRYYFQDSVALTKQSEIERNIKLSIGAELKATLQAKKATLNSKFDVALSDFLDKVVKMSGSYYEIYYTDDYISSVQNILSSVDTSKLPKSGTFNTNFIKFYVDKLGDIIAGIAILDLSFEYSKTDNFKASMGVLINTTVTNAKEINTTEVSAELQSTFEFIKNISAGSSYRTYINLRYYYAPQLQIGSGGDINNN